MKRIHRLNFSLWAALLLQAPFTLPAASALEPESPQISKVKKMEGTLNEIQEMEKRLGKAGVKFSDDGVDLDFLAKARKKLAGNFDEALLEARLQVFSLAIQYFVQEYSGMAPQDTLSQFQKIRKLLGQNLDQFVMTALEESNSFTDFCEGKSSRREVIELARQVAEQLGTESCTEASDLLAEATEISIDEQNLTFPFRNFPFFREARKLNKLVLQGDKEKDPSGTIPWNFAPLENLVHLQTLVVQNSRLDLKALASLKKLKSVSLSGCPMEDISPLAEMKSLRKVAINDGHLRDISPMKTMTSLKEINLDKNKIEDLSPLSSLKLTSFSAAENPLKICPEDSGAKKLNEWCKKFRGGGEN